MGENRLKKINVGEGTPPLLLYYFNLPFKAAKGLSGLSQSATVTTLPFTGVGTDASCQLFKLIIYITFNIYK